MVQKCAKKWNLLHISEEVTDEYEASVEWWLKYKNKNVPQYHSVQHKPDIEIRDVGITQRAMLITNSNTKNSLYCK